MEENSKGMNYVTPQHPLPKEITQMERDETVCKFCGISYLIHNEIKALQIQLKKLEDQLSYYQGSDEREALLKSEVKHLHGEMNNLQITITSKDKIINELKVSNSELTEKLKELQSMSSNYELENKSLREKTESLSKHLVQLSGICVLLKTDMKDINVDINAMKNDMLNAVFKIQNDFQEKIKLFCQTVKNDIKLKSHELKTEITELKFENKKLKDEAGNHETSLLEYKRLQEDHANIMASKAAQNKTITDLQSQVQRDTEKMRALSLECDQFKQQITVKGKENDAKINSFAERERNLQINIESLQKEVENTKTLLQNTESSLQEYKNKFEEYEKRELSLVKNEQTTKGEVELLRKQLSSLNTELTGMKVERDRLIESHKTRMEQLKQSFSNRITEADKWPEKLEEALQNERIKHSNELATVEAKLKENFIIEMQIEKQKHEELISKYTADARDAESRVRAQVSAEMGQLQAEVARLKLRLEDSERRADELMSAADRDDSGRLLRQQLVDRERAMVEAQSAAERAHKVAEEARQEITLLQETVRRECEERFELTEALSAAREELLQLKRPPNGYPASPSTSKRSELEPIVHPQQQQQQTFRIDSGQSQTPSVALRMTHRASLSETSSGVSSRKPPASSATSSRTSSSSVSTAAAMRVGQRAGQTANQPGGSIVQTKRRLAALMAANRQSEAR